MNKLINNIKQLEKDTLSNISSSKATNTKRAYKSDFEHFSEFCKKYNFNPLKADIKTVSLYLTFMSNKAKFSTIKRRMASIKMFHKLSGHYLDFKHPIINENLIGIKKKIGTYQKPKKALNIDELKLIILEIERDSKINNKAKVRNKALILIGFCGAFRRSELVELIIDDLEFVKEGVKIFVKKSKTDQIGEGMIKAIPYFINSHFCPVIASKEWLKILKLEKKQIKKVFKMSDKNVSLIIKKYVSKIGLETFSYSGHSLRSGFATSTANSGAEERQIMSMTGHKSNQMVRRYIHESNLFKNNALKKINL